MQYQKNEAKYRHFILCEGWRMADLKEIKVYRGRGKKIPEHLAKARRDHIQALIDQGTPKAWIARLYRISRTQLYRILSTP